MSKPEKDLSMLADKLIECATLAQVEGVGRKLFLLGADNAYKAARKNLKRFFKKVPTSNQL